ncbi:MAG: response regulator [Bacteriovorax sp.]|nr:response regulator [Bacteriovorax sp.]
MRQILIIDESFTKYEDLRVQLEEQLTIEITTATDAVQAISLLNILPELDFILIDASLPNGLERLTKIEDFLIEEKLETTIFVLGRNPGKRSQTIVITYDLNSTVFLDAIKEQFLKNDAQKKLKDIPLFVPVDFQFLLEHKDIRFPVDFYLRIKISSEDCQYLKRLHANDLFSVEEIDKFKKHNVSNLYVLKNDFNKFLAISLKLTIESKNLESKNVLNKSFDYHLTKEMINLAGVDQETQNLVQTNISHMESAITKNDSLMNYFKLTKQNQNSFSYAHSMLSAMILTKVVSQFEWNSKLIKEKICYVAFFHDISILDDKLTKIHSDDELYEDVRVEYEFQNDSKLSDKKYKSFEIEQVEYHALNSALILEQIPGVPSGVFQIVKEHHGAKNGVGFKDQQSISLQPLSMLFIVVEDFVVKFLGIENPSKEDIKKILKDLELKYNKSNYKKAVEALIQFSI